MVPVGGVQERVEQVALDGALAGNLVGVQQRGGVPAGGIVYVLARSIISGLRKARACGPSGSSRRWSMSHCQRCGWGSAPVRKVTASPMSTGWISRTAACARKPPLRWTASWYSAVRHVMINGYRSVMVWSMDLMATGCSSRSISSRPSRIGTIFCSAMSRAAAPGS